MMHVTFLDHSGFLVELPGLTLLFDWWKGDLPPLPSGPLLVFASHRHPDHFDPRIFALDDGQRDVRFLLGKGIHLTDRNRKKWGLSEKAAADCRVLSGGESASPLPGVTVEALPSTDEGVAFLVTAEGRTVFHAGDLNWWHWEEEDDAYNRMMRGDYQKEIETLTGEKIDLAFVVLDPRQEEQFYWGFDWYMRHTDTKIVFPMHMWKQYEVQDRLIGMEVSEPYREKIMRIREMGQVFEL